MAYALTEEPIVLDLCQKGSIIRVVGGSIIRIVGGSIIRVVEGSIIRVVEGSIIPIVAGAGRPQKRRFLWVFEQVSEWPKGCPRCLSTLWKSASARPNSRAPRAPRRRSVPINLIGRILWGGAARLVSSRCRRRLRSARTSRTAPTV